MISFQVTVNGTLLCTAGVDDDGVLNAIVSWVGHRSTGSAEALIDLHVGGFTKGVHLCWVDGFHKLTVGDVVAVSVVESESVDPAIETSPVATTAGQQPSAEDPLRCAFCGKHQREVRKLVPGPVVSICDRCIGVCAELAQESGTST